MSLIDEALKRARDQASPAPAAGAGEPPPAAPKRHVDPWAYAPLPHARRRPPGLRRVTAVIFGILVAGAAAWIWRERPGAGIFTGPKRPASAAPAPAPTPAPPPALSPPPVSGPAGSPESGRSAEKGPGAAEVLAGRNSAPPLVPQRRAAAPRVEETVPERRTDPLPQDLPDRRPDPLPQAAPPQPLPRPASRAVDGGTYIGAVIAPDGARVELGGIVYSETNASALLNGRILPVGAVVEGLTIISIEENRVELSADGITIHLALR